jgi:hypothetical protein
MHRIAEPDAGYEPGRVLGYREVVNPLVPWIVGGKDRALGRGWQRVGRSGASGQQREQAGHGQANCRQKAGVTHGAIIGGIVGAQRPDGRLSDPVSRAARLETVRFRSAVSAA